MFTFLLAVALMGGSCKKEKTASPASYFPLEEGMEWCYKSYNGDTEDEEALIAKVSWNILGDTLIEGKTYLQLTMGGYPFKALREENGNFYKRKVTGFSSTTSEELLFLKTTQPDGAAWEQVAGNYKYEFAQTLLPQFASGGQTWKNVIEVKVTIAFKQPDGTFEPFPDHLTGTVAYARYYFAPGTGVVQVYEPPVFNQFSEFAYTVSNFMVLSDCM